MFNLTTFDFNNKNIRVVKVDNEIYFVGKDIAEALEYVNPTKAIRDLVTAEYKGETEMDTPGGKQMLVVVSEFGVYDLIFSSKKAEAKAFKKRVYEIIKEINETGSYSINPLPTRNIDSEFDIAGKMAAFLSGGNKKVEMQQRFRLAAVIEPKFAGALEEAKKEYADANSVSFSKLLNAGDISKLLCERGIVEYNTANKVNNLMAVKGLQTKPRKNWKPTSLAKKLELCNEVDSTAPIGQKTNKWIGKTLKWNIEIVDYLINSLEEEATVEDTKTYMPSIGENSMTDCMPEFDFD